ncbi:MAG: hypothetical protein Fur0028_12980 [Bacteroidales bacterium]
MKNIYYLFLLIILFLFCTNQKKSDNLIPTKVLYNDSSIYEVPVRIRKNSYFYPEIIKFISYQNKACILVGFGLGNTYLYIYKLNEPKPIDSIRIYINHYHARNINYINEDSILFFNNHIDGWNDSLLYVYNHSKKTIHFYPLSNKVGNNEQDKYIYTNCEDQLSLVDSKLILFQDYYYAQKYRYPNVFSYDIKTKEMKFKPEIKVPNAKPGQYYSNDIDHLFYTVSHNNNALIAFSTAPYVCEWNLKNDKAEYHRIKSRFIDTIIPQTDTLNFKDRTTFCWGINYLKKYHVYYIINVLPEDYNYQRMFVYFDTSFNYLGERIAYNNEYPVLSDDTNLYTIKINRNNFILYNVDLAFESYDEIKLKAKLDKIKNEISESCKKVQLNKNEQDAKKQEELLIKYLGSKYKMNDNYIAIFLNTNGCHSCNEYILNSIKYNTHLLSFTKRNYLIHYIDLQGTTSKFNDLKNFYNLGRFDHVVQDTSLYYEHFLCPYESLNPRIIEVHKNKIVYDTVYMYDNAERFMMKFFDYLK